MADGALDLDGVEDAFPATPEQAGMLFHSLAEPGRGVYLAVFSALLPAGVDIDRLKQAWSAVVARHQSLRSFFVWRGVETPLMVVRTDTEPVWEEETVAAEAVSARLEALRTEDVALDGAPCFRLVLLRRDDGRAQLAWICHHALIDDWSAAIVFREVAAFYHAAEAGSPPALEPPPPYRPFVEWRLAGDTAASKTFWRDWLGDVEAPSILKTGPVLQASASPEAHFVRRQSLSSDETAALKTMARSLRVSLSDVVVALWGLVLSRATGAGDVVYGVAATMRSTEVAGAENAVGNFVTTLAHRIRPPSSETLRALFRSVAEAMLDAQQHSRFPLSQIPSLTLAGAGAPVFDTIVSMENADRTIEPSGSPNPLFVDFNALDRSHFALSVLVWPGDALSVEMHFDAAQHSPAAVESLLEMMTAGLRAAPEHLDASPAALPLVGVDAGSELVGPDLAVAPTLLLDRFEAHAAATPDALAVATRDRTLSYGDLNRRARALAQRLSEAGVAPGARIALALDRGPDAVVAMLASFKLGCAYAPLDPEQPIERLKSLIEALDAAAVVAGEESMADLASAFAPRRAVVSPTDCVIDAAADFVERRPAPDDVAYLIFTSGSTGTPKGVEITHANLAYSTAARIAFYDDAPGVFLLLSPLFFDSSVVGLYWALGAGGAVAMPGRGEEKDMAAVAALCRQAAVTHTLALPSLLAVLAAYAPAGSLKSLRTAIVAGEAVNAAIVERIRSVLPNVTLYNEYGPTETTVWCAAADITDAGPGPVPIGVAPPGAQLSLRSADGRTTPRGFPGELWVAGPGVARGYLDRPDETADRFVTVDGEATRWYRTGDLASLRVDGSLDYLGRADSQIKIRGHRIELAEVEASIERSPDVAEVAATVFGDGASARLVAFATSARGGAIDEIQTLDAVRRVLPIWMVPERLISLPSLPRLPNGKVDRRRLQEPPRPAGAVAPPTTPLEKELAPIWRDVLGLDRDIGVNEDFVASGGHSLAAIRLLGEVELRLGRRLPPETLGRLTTIAAQAALLEREDDLSAVAAAPPMATQDDARDESDYDDPFAGLTDEEARTFRAYCAGWPGEPAIDGASIFVLNADGSSPPLFWCFNSGEEFQSLAQALGPDQPVYGFRSANLILDLSAETQRVNNRKLAMHILPELLRVQPHGPYYLGGNCQGAAVAMELALALHGLCEEAPLLVLMEAVPDHRFHGHVALIFGRDSEENPFSSGADPTTVWRERYQAFSVDLISGEHGAFFRSPHVDALARALSKRLAAAQTTDASSTAGSGASVGTSETTDAVVDAARQALDEGAFQNAAAALEPFVDGMPETLVLAARSQVELRDAAAAERNFKAALQLAPGHLGAAIGLAQLLLQADRPVAALRVVRRASRPHAFLSPDLEALRAQALERINVPGRAGRKVWREIRRLFRKRRKPRR